KTNYVIVEYKRYSKIAPRFSAVKDDPKILDDPSVVRVVDGPYRSWSAAVARVDELNRQGNPAQGVKFVLGISGSGRNRKSEVQSVLFDKHLFTLVQAREWLRDHEFKVPAVDEQKGFYRFRQREPGRYKEFSTIEAGAHNPAPGWE